MTYKIYTLGCKVNTYESNVMSDILKNNGYNSTLNNASVAIINTCTVTNVADSKCIKTIKRCIKDNPNAIVIVCGCLSQNKTDIISSIDGVDIIIGNIFKTKIIDYIERYKKEKKQIIDVYDITNTEFETMKLNNFDKTRAFVKIQDGCNNFCSYCIIPYTRGNVRSKKKDDVIEEVKSLINNGHKEIVLTGIHTGNYGVEFENYNFANLLNDLVKIKGLERLRISSIEITEITEEVLNVIKNNSILVDHMHIPLQSGSNEVLKRMNRKYNKEYFIDKINSIRKIRPNISITTDVIVGFPGESGEEFLETIETINKIKFSKLHVFPYSKRDKTEAAEFSNQIDQTTKKERAKILIKISKELEIDYMNKFLNKDLIFIPEIEKDGFVIGHTGNYLLIKTLGNKELLNKNIKVNIKSVNYPSLIGEKID